MEKQNNTNPEFKIFLFNAVKKIYKLFQNITLSHLTGMLICNKCFILNLCHNYIKRQDELGGETE